MEILNLICNACATFLFGAVLMVVLITFCASIVACFSKKWAGTLVAKIAIAFVLGCSLPWLFKVVVYFAMKTIGA